MFVGEIKFTGFEESGVCWWCGGELKGRQRRYCCPEHEARIMIKKWLVKHWYVNEAGKLLLFLFFAYISYTLWKAGSIIPNSKGACLVGFESGMSGALAIMMIVDIISVLFNIIRGQKPYSEQD